MGRGWERVVRKIRCSGSGCLAPANEAEAEKAGSDEGDGARLGNLGEDLDVDVRVLVPPVAEACVRTAVDRPAAIAEEAVHAVVGEVLRGARERRIARVVEPGGEGVISEVSRRPGAVIGTQTIDSEPDLLARRHRHVEIEVDLEHVDVQTGRTLVVELAPSAGILYPTDRDVGIVGDVATNECPRGHLRK